MDLQSLLKSVVTNNASDLHVTENSPPVFRIDGNLVLSGFPSLSRDHLKSLIYGFLSNDQKKELEGDRELDFSLDLEGCDRFRVNVHWQRGCVEAAFRRICSVIPSVDDLGLPKVIRDLAMKPNGLILMTGSTGSGKTTTLSAMIDFINKERSCMIISIEDPIEYIHVNQKSVIKQREVHSDTHSFSEALRRCLRQDPDVIVVGELRDLETISTALTAAETGHLVLATLHTSDAKQTIERMVDVFPPHQQQQVRLQLSASLQGILSQALLPKAQGGGRALAMEILIATPAIRNLIREHSVEQMANVIQTGADRGMQSLDSALRHLVQEGIVTFEDALKEARNPDEFRNMLG